MDMGIFLYSLLKDPRQPSGTAAVFTILTSQSLQH